MFEVHCRVVLPQYEEVKKGPEKADFKIRSNVRMIRVHTTSHNHNNFVDKYKVKRTAFDRWCECNRKLKCEHDRTCTATS